MRQAVILAGGKGTRLKSISRNIPKPMVYIQDKPLLEHLIQKCAQYGIFDIKLLVSYKKEQIEEYFGDGARFGVFIKYIYEEVPKGTAGALIDALPELNKCFLVIYGDTFFDIDLNSFWNFHQNHSEDASIFLHPNDHPFDSDLVELNSDYQIKKIHPYPHKTGNWLQNLVNAGIYILNKKVFDDIKLQNKKDLPDIAKDLFPTMLKSRKKLYGYISTEYIKDMGTPKRLKKLEEDISSGKIENLKRQKPKVAFFLDRDGTINKEVGHLSNIDKFELFEGVAKSISKINAAGILVIVITNQPVIARGELKESELKKVHNKMETLLGRDGAYVDRIYYCPHHTDLGFKNEVKSLKFDCECRKPKIGLFLQAKNDLNIDLEKSWLVGDTTTDILAAKNAGIKSVLVKTGMSGEDRKHRVTPDFIVEDLNSAVDLFLRNINSDNQ